MRLLAIVLPFALVACESDLYHWNLSHAYVTPQTHISRSDFEQIVQAATHATGQTVLQISPLSATRDGHPQVSVDSSDQSLVLAKKNGTWQVTAKGAFEE